MIGVIPIAGPESTPVVSPPTPPAPVPTRVLAAMNFVGMCNQHMGMRYFGECDGEEDIVRTEELHPAQEGVFRIACKLIGDYFSEGIDAS